MSPPSPSWTTSRPSSSTLQTFNVKEGTLNAVVTVLRTGTLTSPATVTFSATPGTAQPVVDFTPVSGTLTFPANTPSKTFNVPIINNTRLDGTRTVALALGNPTGGAQLGTQRTATLNIDDNEQAGTFKLDKGSYTVLESAGFVSINVLRTGLNLTGNVSVNLIATDGTAKNGTNYTAPATPLVFAAGETTKPVKIPILRDSMVTGLRNFTLALSEPSSGATVVTPGSATVNITEADVAGQVRFSAATALVNESAGSVTLTVLRTGGTAGGVVVQYTTFDGTATVEGNDYGSPPARSPSDRANVQDDHDTDRPGRRVGRQRIVPGAAQPAGSTNPTKVTLGSPATTTVTIMDDDSSMVQFSGNFIGNFPEIVRSGSLANDAFVDFGSIDGTAIGITDYTPTSGTLTFKANTRATVIPLVIFNDTIAEGFETFTYLLRNPRGTKLGPESQQTFTITDNDFGGSNIQFTQPLFGGGEGTTVTLTIVRTGGIGSSLAVQWSAGEGTATPGVDFTPASGTVTFGANAQTASFTINLLTDSFLEGTETVPITLSMPEAAATLGPQSTTTLQIQDAAPPASVVQFTAPTFSAVYGQDKEITLTRSGALGTPLTVNWATSGGTAVPGEDFDPTAGVVTFGPNDTTASFTITTREASSGEPDVTAIFGLSIASGTATIGAVGTTTLTIFGATSEISLDLSVYSVTEGGGPAIISVSRRGNLNRQVSASFATSNGTAIAGTHYTTQTGTVTFPVGVDTATFTVPILSNGPGDGTRTVNLTLSNPSPNTTLGEGDSARLDIREGPVYTFRRIAETDAEQDGDVFAFAGVPGINDAGTVAFRALLTDVRERIFTGNGGELSTVAGTSPGGFVQFGNRVPIDNDGQVAFLALRANETQGIFRGDEESLSTVATTSAQLSQLFDPAMSRNGRVAFVGQTPQGPLRLFSGTPGGPFPLVPGTDGSLFTNLGIHPAVNDDGRVAFVANSEPGRGIYSVAPNGDIEILADDVEVVTSTNVSFNNFGRLAFIPGLGNIRQSVLLSAGEGDVVPFATAANGFQNFGDVSEDDNSPVISDRGDVAFVALTQAGNLGILNGPSPTGNMAIQVGDPLFGSTVAFLTFGAINASGQIAFRATLLDGREVVAVATPPATLADLAVTKAVNNASPLVGANVTFTVTATNNGPAAVTTATVTDLLPSGYTFVSATPSKGIVRVRHRHLDDRALTGTAPGNSATLTITATVRATGTYANTASISAVGVTDPVPANNSATATATPALAADIAVTKTVNIPSPVIGSNVIFTLTATNNGPGAATGVQVTDLLPTGYTFVSSLPGQGTYTSASGIWAVGSLAANASATLQLTAQVRATGTLPQHGDADRLNARPTRRGQQQRHRHGESDLRHRADDRWTAGRRRSHDQRRGRDSHAGSGRRRHRHAHQQPNRSADAAGHRDDQPGTDLRALHPHRRGARRHDHHRNRARLRSRHGPRDGDQ